METKDMLGAKQSNEESASAPENATVENLENTPTEEDDLPF